MKMRKRREWFVIFLILPMVFAQYDLKNDLYGAERISFHPAPPPVFRQPTPPPQFHANARGYQAPPHAAFFQPPRSYNTNSYLNNNFATSNVQRPGVRPPVLPHSSANFAPPKHSLPHRNLMPEVFNDWRMAQLHEQHPQRFNNLVNQAASKQPNVLKQFRTSEAVRRPVFANGKPEYQEIHLTPIDYASDASIPSTTPTTYRPPTVIPSTQATTRRAPVVYESDLYDNSHIASSPPSSQPTRQLNEQPYNPRQTAPTEPRPIPSASHSNYDVQITSKKPYIKQESQTTSPTADDSKAYSIHETPESPDYTRIATTQFIPSSTAYPYDAADRNQFKTGGTTTSAPLRTAVGIRIPVKEQNSIPSQQTASYEISDEYNNPQHPYSPQAGQTPKNPASPQVEAPAASSSQNSYEGTQALVSISQRQLNNRVGPPAPPQLNQHHSTWTTTPISPIVVGSRTGNRKNLQNFGSSNVISNTNEVNNIIVHIFLNAKDNKHPHAHATTKLGPFHGTFGVGTSHGGPGTNANPIVITKDFDRDRLRFVDSQTAENMMESGPTNIVEVKAMVSSPDQHIGSTLNRAVSTELDRAIPVVLDRFKGPTSGMDGELRKELEQALVDEIAKNLGQTIDDISTDVTEDDLTQLIEEGLKEFENDKNEITSSTSSPSTTVTAARPETTVTSTTRRIIVTTSEPTTTTTRRVITTNVPTTTSPRTVPTTTTTTTRAPTTTSTTTRASTIPSTTQTTTSTTTTRTSPSTTTTTSTTSTTTTTTRSRPPPTTTTQVASSTSTPSTRKPLTTTIPSKTTTIDFDLENEVNMHQVDSSPPKQELETMSKSTETTQQPVVDDEDYDSSETDIVHNPEDDVDELPSEGERTTQSELRTTSISDDTASENAVASRVSTARTTIQTFTTTTTSLHLLPPVTTPPEDFSISDESEETSRKPMLSIVDLSEPDDELDLTSPTPIAETEQTRSLLITLTASTMGMDEIPLKTSPTPLITTMLPFDETSPFSVHSDTFKINPTASTASNVIESSTRKMLVVDSSSEEVLANMPDLTEPIVDEHSDSSEVENEPFKHNMPFEHSQPAVTPQSHTITNEHEIETVETTTWTNGGDVQMQPESVIFPQGQCPILNNMKDQNRSDVLFLLDSSNSFNEDKFMHAITLILHTVDYFQNIGPDGVQFSLVQYNSEPYLEFSLRKHNCKQWLLDDIADTEYMTGRSMLGKALDKVSKFAFTKKRGDRADAENVLIILTGGESDDHIQQPVKIAKQNNMTVLVIATLEADPSYLLNLAGDTENVFQLDDSPNAPLAAKLAQRIVSTSTKKIPDDVVVSDNVDSMEIHQPVRPVDFNDLNDDKEELTVTSQPIVVNKENPSDRLIQMECAPDGFEIELNLPSNFHGHVVVKGQEKKEKCRKAILPIANNSENQTISFFVGNDECEIQSMKSTKPEGKNSTMILHLVHDPSLRTDKDRAYLLQCFVGTGETSEAEVSTNLDVLKNDITIAETISLTSVPPTCSYSIRKNSPDGPTITKTTVGQTVYHRWECDGGDEANHVYGIQVHNCYASDDIEQKYPIVDNRGCSSDLAVLSDPFYEDEKLVAFAVSHAFGFKDTESLKFVCKLSLCTRDGDGCEGVTPPVCGKSQNQTDLLLTRKIRHHSSAIEKALTSALSTEVDLTSRRAEIREKITEVATSHITLGVIALLFVALTVTGVVSKLYSPRSGSSSSSSSSADDESQIGFSPISSPHMTLRLPSEGSSPIISEPTANPRLVEFLRDFDRQRYV